LSSTSRNPVVKGEIYSSNLTTGTLTNVVINLYRGTSTDSAFLIESSTISVNSSVSRNFEYQYHNLDVNSQYAVYVWFEAIAGDTSDATVVFTTVGSGISKLTPYPSPYNSNSGKPFKIKYAIDEDCDVSINIYDRAGKLVSKVLSKENRSAGEHDEVWNAKSYSGDSLANGVYICEIITKGSKENRRYSSFAIIRK